MPAAPATGLREMARGQRTSLWIAREGRRPSRFTDLGCGDSHSCVIGDLLVCLFFLI